MVKFYSAKVRCWSSMIQGAVLAMQKKNTKNQQEKSARPGRARNKKATLIVVFKKSIGISLSDIMVLKII